MSFGWVLTTADEVVDDKATLFGDVVTRPCGGSLLNWRCSPSEVESPEGKLASTDYEQGGSVVA